MSDLPEPGAELARRLQATIRAELGLPCSLGIATNRLVAKIATDVGKAAIRADGYSNTIQVVPPGQEAAFLAPLPAMALWGVGPKTADNLAGLGIHTIGDLARWPEGDLVHRFGKVGHDPSALPSVAGQALARRAGGVDERPVVTSREAKFISQEVAFAQDVRDPEVRRAGLREMQRELEARAEPLRQRLARYDKLLTECKAEAAALVDEFLEQRNGNTPEVLRQAVEAKVRELEKRQQSYQAEHDELAARLVGLTITDEEIKRADAVFNEMYQTLADYDAGLNGATFDDKERIFDMLQVQGDMVDKDGQRGVLLTCRRPGEQHLVHLNKKDNYKKY